MKPAVGIVLVAIALSSVHASKSLVGVKHKESAVNSASGSVESWDFSWDASGSEDSGSGCDAICPTNHEPVCGSDGVTYTNDCAFGIAQCKTTGLTLSAVGECAGGSIASSSEVSKAGSAAKACPDACLDVYDPVSDASGKTYSNECYMRMAKCKNMKKDVDILAEYKKLYGRSFGASRDDDDSVSKEKDSSSKQEEATKAPSKAEKSSKTSKTTKSAKTSSTNTSGVGSLYEDGSEGVIGSGSSSPAKTCADACPDIYSPVCGSNGVSYNNPCLLKLASCKNPELKIVKASEDVCAGSGATTTSQQQTVSKNSSKSTTTTTA